MRLYQLRPAGTLLIAGLIAFVVADQADARKSRRRCCYTSYNTGCCSQSYQNVNTWVPSCAAPVSYGCSSCGSVSSGCSACGNGGIVSEGTMMGAPLSNEGGANLEPVPSESTQAAPEAPYAPAPTPADEKKMEQQNKPAPPNTATDAKKSADTSKDTAPPKPPSPPKPKPAGN